MHILTEFNKAGSVSSNKNASVGFILQDIYLTLFQTCFEINVVFNVAQLLWNC